MSLQGPGITPIKKVYSATLKSLKDYPAIFIPFLIFAIFEFLSLIIIYFIPRPPLRLIFGPPIRVFWGERFLHYPLNFLLLPKLASLSRMCLSVFLGSLFTGMAVAIISDIYHKKHLKLKPSFEAALKRYFYLFSVVFIFTLIFYIFQKILTIGLAKYFMAGHTRLLFLGPRIWLGPLLLSLNFILALFIQSAFIYAIPILMIEKEKLTQAIQGSFTIFKKLFIPTVILVGLPMLLYIPMLLLQRNSAFLINRVFPEVILLLSVLSIVLGSLVIDPLITISATFLYLKHKEK